MKKSIYASLGLVICCMIASIPSAEAQLLKGLKEKAGKVLEGSQKSSKSKQQSSSGNNSNDSWDDEEDLNADIKGNVRQIAKLKDRTKEDYDHSGAVVISVNHSMGPDCFTDFAEGMAWVDAYGTGTFFIDMQGNKYLFDIRPTHMAQLMGGPRFENGHVIMKTPEGRIAIYDKKGTILKTLPAYVTDATNFVDGISLVQISPLSQSISSLKDIAAATGLDYKAGYTAVIDYNGNFIMKNLYEKYPYDMAWQNIQPIKEGLRPYAIHPEGGSRKFGFIDANGKWVIEPKYSAVSDFENGMALVCETTSHGFNADDKWGWIDKSGNYVIQPKYSIVPGPFDPVSGLARVSDKKHNKYFIDRRGNQVYGPVEKWPDNEDLETRKKPTEISHFVNGKALAQYTSNGYLYGVIDSNFRTLYFINEDPDVMADTGYADNGLLNVSAKLIDLDKGEIVHHVSSEVHEDSTTGLTRVYTSRGAGYADRNGKVKILFEESEF